MDRISDKPAYPPVRPRLQASPYRVAVKGSVGPLLGGPRSIAEMNLRLVLRPLSGFPADQEYDCGLDRFDLTHVVNSVSLYPDVQRGSRQLMSPSIDVMATLTLSSESVSEASSQTLLCDADENRVVLRGRNRARGVIQRRRQRRSRSLLSL